MARVEWEDGPRPAGDVIFETASEFAEEFIASPEAFAVVCALQARRDRERRIRVEAPLCPRLREGLDQAFAVLNSWFPTGSPVPRVEAPAFAVRYPPAARAAVLVSGGVDSARLILANRKALPRRHPRAFRDAIFLYGAVNRADVPPSALANLVERQRRCVEGLCRLTGLRLLPVFLDIEALGDERSFVLGQGHGARLASAGHLFRSLSSVSIASSYFAGELFPWGSHPLLDPCLASSSLEVRHEGIHLRRLEAVRALADRPEALRYLMVCGEAPVDAVNCGRCEKCLRTLLEIDLAGVLAAATTFPSREIRPDDLDALFPQPSVIPYWRDLARALGEAGRRELSRAADRVAGRAERYRAWVEERGFRGRIRRFDRIHLAGRLTAARRALRRIAG